MAKIVFFSKGTIHSLFLSCCIIQIKDLFTLDFRALRLFLHSEVFADEAEFQKKLFHALHIQAGSVMAVIVLYTGNILIAFREELVIVQITGVAGDAVVVAHVDSLCHLFAGYQCLIQFLAVARADGLHLRLTVFRINLRVCFLQGLRQYIQGSGRYLGCTGAGLEGNIRAG